MHVNHADLRAYVDNELPGARRAGIEQHLSQCPACRARRVAVARQAERVNAQLAVLAPAPAEAPQPMRQARQIIEHRGRKDLVDMLRSWLAKRSAWVGLTALVVVALAFSFAPVRAWAGQFLGLFRVQRIEVLPVDTTRLASLGGDATLGEQFGQIFADSVTITKEPGEPTVAASAAEAGALAGFAVRGLSAAKGQPVISVQGGTAFEVVIDRDRAQAILNEAGRGDLVLPEALDGAHVAIEIPTAVTAAYGSCSGGAVGAFGHEPSDPDNRRSYVDSSECVLLAQVPSPTVEAPPDLNLAQLAELGLQFTGMSAEEARSFSQTVDWTTTLVVPIPRNEADYEQVAVDGVTGTLVYATGEHSYEPYVVMWVKDGIVYALSAFGNPAEAVALANSIE